MSKRWLTTVLENHSLPALVAETGWRGIRTLRRRSFRPGREGACPVRFEPVGLPALEIAPVTYADAVLRGEFPLLGYGSTHLGLAPDWQRDWVSGKSWPMLPSGRLRIIRHDGSDVKAPWELSRLQWAPVVAQSWACTGEQKYRDVLRWLLTDWIKKNPVGRGVNWTVAMEASLRAISLCLTMERLWPFAEEEQGWLEQLTSSLWQHLRFVEAHIEFSLLVRSNHYLSNIVGLTTLAAYLRGPGMARRLRKHARAVQREIFVQTYADGGDREASTGYHVLVAQMLLHSWMVQRKTADLSRDRRRRGVKRSAVRLAAFEERLRLMFAWIGTLSDGEGKLPLLGDCDNGRVELLREDIEQSGLPPSERHSLRVASLCRRASDLLQVPPEHFSLEPGLLPNSGIGTLHSGDASVVFCAMPNGLGGKGSHTHCDKLSILLRLGSVEVFSDSGSRVYTRSAAMRNADRSTAAHTTLVVDGEEQNIFSNDPGSLFVCGNQAVVSPITMSGRQMKAAHFGYQRLGVEHIRTVELGEGVLSVLDVLKGGGEHTLDLRYILGPEWRAYSEMMMGNTVGCEITGPRTLTLACEAASWLTLSISPVAVSREYGASLAGICISIKTTAHLPARLETRVVWN